MDERVSARYQLNMRRLHLAMWFGNEEYARRHLSALFQMSHLPAVKAMFTREVEHALLWALSGNRVEFVKMFASQVRK